MWKSFLTILEDAPPAYAFEISEAGVAMARPDAGPAVEFRPLPPDTLRVSPLEDNILMPDTLAEVVKELAPPEPGKKNRDAAVLVPDYAVRVAVLDFDSFPKDAKEQASLVKFRLKKSVPFDIESAILGYAAQPGDRKKTEVVVAVATLEILARYEAPFRAAGLQPGFLTPSCLGLIHLLDGAGSTVVAKLSGRFLTILVMADGRLKLARCLETPPDLPGIAADLYPTFVFMEDQMGRKAERLILCGFSHHGDAVRQLAEEMAIRVETLQSPLGAPGEYNAGLLGYLAQAQGAAV